MAEVIDISDSDEEAAAAEEEEEAAEAAPEATESLTPQAGRPLVDELDLVDSQRGLKCAICALHNLLQQRRFSDAEARLAAVHVECKSAMTGGDVQLGGRQSTPWQRRVGAQISLACID